MVCEGLIRGMEETKGRDTYDIGKFWWLIASLIELRNLWKITILVNEGFKLDWG